MNQTPNPNSQAPHRQVPHTHHKHARLQTSLMKQGMIDALTGTSGPLESRMLTLLERTHKPSAVGCYTQGSTQDGTHTPHPRQTHTRTSELLSKATQTSKSSSAAQVPHTHHKHARLQIPNRRTHLHAKKTNKHTNTHKTSHRLKTFKTFQR